MSSNSNSNSNSNTGRNAGVVIGALIGGAALAGGAYLMSKLFNNSENEQKQAVQTRPRPPFPRQSGTQCIVCREETDRRNRIILKCNHIVHNGCYQVLREMGGTSCPVPNCRRSFEE